MAQDLNPVVPQLAACLPPRRQGATEDTSIIVSMCLLVTELALASAEH